jgi:hypothetical protein
MQQVGGSFGAAVLAVVLTRQLGGRTTTAAAFDRAFWWSLAFTALAVVPAFLLPRVRRERDVLSRT